MSLSYLQSIVLNDQCSILHENVHGDGYWTDHTHTHTQTHSRSP